MALAMNEKRMKELSTACINCSGGIGSKNQSSQDMYLFLSLH